MFYLRHAMEELTTAAWHCQDKSRKSIHSPQIPNNKLPVVFVQKRGYNLGYIFPGCFPIGFSHSLISTTMAKQSTVRFPWQLLDTLLQSVNSEVALSIETMRDRPETLRKKLIPINPCSSHRFPLMTPEKPFIPERQPLHLKVPTFASPIGFSNPNLRVGGY
jgi:hypothetical protein